MSPRSEVSDKDWRDPAACLRWRIRRMLALPLEDLSEDALGEALSAIQDEAMSVNR